MSAAATILITGGTNGLGFEAAKAIAQAAPNDKLILTSRSNPHDAATSINVTTGAQTASFIPLDLANLQTIRDFVKNFATQKNPPIRALYLNAGIQVRKGISYTADGFETTFGVNHVGHALLFYLLRPYLRNDCHIIITSSGTHDPAQKSFMPDALYISAEGLAHPTDIKADPLQRYSSSKLANMLWTYALHRRVTELKSSSKELKWTVAAFDPGLMPGTGLARDYSALAIFIWNHILPHLVSLMRLLIAPNIHKASDSGASLAALSRPEKASQIDGKYFEGSKPIKSSDVSYETTKQEELWQWTIETLAKDEEEKRSFDNVVVTKLLE